MKSRLHVSACQMQKKTILKDVYCEAPYRIMLPFYKERWMETVIMSASAGIFGGDDYESHFEIGEGTRVRIKNQSYEKVFQKKEQSAVKRLKIEVARNAAGIYLLYPVIPFAKSRYECSAEIYLNDRCTFLYGDIFNCGRVGMKERFKMDWFCSRTKIYENNRLVFADHTCLNPEQWNYSKIGLWHDYTHNGMMYIHFSDKQQEDVFLKWFRDWSKENAKRESVSDIPPLYWGSTRCLSGIGIRVLGMEGDRIYQAFEKIAGKVKGILS